MDVAAISAGVRLPEPEEPVSRVQPPGLGREQRMEPAQRVRLPGLEKAQLMDSRSQGQPGLLELLVDPVRWEGGRERLAAVPQALDVHLALRPWAGGLASPACQLQPAVRHRI